MLRETDSCWGNELQKYPALPSDGLQTGQGPLTPPGGQAHRQERSVARHAEF